MILTVKLILHPTKEQELKFKKVAGIARFIYNRCLSYKMKEYETYGRTPDIQEQIDYVKLLKNNQFEFVKEAPEAVTKQAIIDLYDAYKKFFSGLSNFPRFKTKKKSTQSFYQRTDNLKFFDNKVTITKVGRVKYTTTYKNLKTLNLTGGFKNPRVKYDGKYWVLTFGLESSELPKEVTTNSIGIDVGVKTLATLSNGKQYKGVTKDTRYLKVERRLKRKQRKLSHKYECNLKNNLPKYYESQSIKNLKREIKLLYRKLTNIRKTYLHTVTKDIVKTKPYLITVEDLNTKGMMKNKHLSKAIATQSFYKFFEYLTYKAKRRHIQVIKASRTFASSKICSNCGNKKKKLSLSERAYHCECGHTIDRDINASINLDNYGKLQYLQTV